LLLLQSKVFIYPRMFSIHDMSTDTGLPCDNADEDCPTAGPSQVRLPSILNLSYERLSSNGIFLLENGHDLFMWVGRAVNPAIISTLFGVNSLEGADMSQVKILAENSDFSTRVDAVITALRQDRARYVSLCSFILTVFFIFQLCLLSCLVALFFLCINLLPQYDQPPCLCTRLTHNQYMHTHSLMYIHLYIHSYMHHHISRYMQLHFIREGDGYAEAYFARYLIEDRANFSGGGMSYTEYHAHVTRAVSGMPM
jgi:hypothetical protein